MTPTTAVAPITRSPRSGTATRRRSASVAHRAAEGTVSTYLRDVSASAASSRRSTRTVSRPRPSAPRAAR